MNHGMSADCCSPCCCRDRARRARRRPCRPPPRQRLDGARISTWWRISAPGELSGPTRPHAMRWRSAESAADLGAAARPRSRSTSRGARCTSARCGRTIHPAGPATFRSFDEADRGAADHQRVHHPADVHVGTCGSRIRIRRLGRRELGARDPRPRRMHSSVD